MMVYLDTSNRSTECQHSRSRRIKQLRVGDLCIVDSMFSLFVDDAVSSIQRFVSRCLSVIDVLLTDKVFPLPLCILLMSLFYVGELDFNSLDYFNSAHMSLGFSASSRLDSASSISDGITTQSVYHTSCTALTSVTELY